MYLPRYLCRHLAELDQLLGAGIERRRIDQRRADAERARLHLAADDGPHLVELRGRRLPVGESDHVLADGRRAEERSDVLRDPAPFDLREILRQRGPGDLELQVAHLLGHPPLHRVVERPHRRALAENLGRHALANFTLGTAVDEQRLGRPRQHVDETRRDRHAGGVDRGCRAGGGKVADRRDAVAADAHVGPASRVAAAVVDRAAAHDDVERPGLGGASGGGRRQAKCQNSVAHVERLSAGLGLPAALPGAFAGGQEVFCRRNVRRANRARSHRLVLASPTAACRKSISQEGHEVRRCSCWTR